MWISADPLCNRIVIQSHPQSCHDERIDTALGCGQKGTRFYCDSTHYHPLKCHWCGTEHSLKHVAFKFGKSKPAPSSFFTFLLDNSCHYLQWRLDVSEGYNRTRRDTFKQKNPNIRWFDSDLVSQASGHRTSCYDVCGLTRGEYRYTHRTCTSYSLTWDWVFLTPPCQTVLYRCHNFWRRLLTLLYWR